MPLLYLLFPTLTVVVTPRGDLSTETRGRCELELSRDTYGTREHRSHDAARSAAAMSQIHDEPSSYNVGLYPERLVCWPELCDRMCMLARERAIIRCDSWHAQWHALGEA